ncbi:MAG: hypothetical protein ACLUNO_09170 [Oscillospiraceae bacterium]
MDLKQLTYKLQAALNQRGEHYKVNQLQHYSGAAWPDGNKIRAGKGRNR